MSASHLTAPHSASRQPSTNGPGYRARSIAALATAVTVLGSSQPALALDGCKVLLCLAAPSWRAIPQCVPTITQLFRDLARGRAFPTCSMSGPGNSSSHAWAVAPDNCPPQYTTVTETVRGPVYRCDFAGAVAIRVNGVAYTRTWWSLDGGAVTEFSPTAKAQLGSWDTRFDDDYAAWLAAQQPTTPPEPTN